MRIRSAGAMDAADLGELYIELKDSQRRLQPGNQRYEVPDDDWRNLARRDVVDEGVGVLVAEDNGSLVGFVRVSFVDKVWGKSCQINTLAVTEMFRGKGIGTALMRRAEDLATEEGARGVRVNVLVENTPARRFYERLGYGAIAVIYGKSARRPR